MALWDTMGHYEFGILTMAYYGRNLNLLMQSMAAIKSKFTVVHETILLHPFLQFTVFSQYKDMYRVVEDYHGRPGMGTMPVESGIWV